MGVICAQQLCLVGKLKSNKAVCVSFIQGLKGLVGASSLNLSEAVLSEVNEARLWMMAVDPGGTKGKSGGAGGAAAAAPRQGGSDF